MVGKCMRVGAKEPLRDSRNPSPWRDLLGHVKPSCATRAGGNQKTQHACTWPLDQSDPPFVVALVVAIAIALVLALMAIPVAALAVGVVVACMAAITVAPGTDHANMIRPHQ